MEVSKAQVEDLIYDEKNDTLH